MAHECHNLSTRMAVVNQNVDKRHLYETIFTHFKSHKVEISDAIKTTFPFLEMLRDRGFITNELYKDYEKARENMSPVQKIVYDVLCVLEEKLDMSLMKILFSKSIVSKYPDLNDVREGFRNVIQEKFFYQEMNGKERAENPNIQLSLEQGTDENCYQNLTWLFSEPLSYNARPENELPEQFRELPEPINAVETGTTSDNDVLENQRASEQRAQVSKPAGAPAANHGIPRNSCSAELLHIKTEKPFVQSGIQVETQTQTNRNQASDAIVISEDSAEYGGGEEPPVASTSAVKRRPESTDLRTPPTSGKKLCKRKRSPEESPKLSADQASRGACGSAVRTGPGEKGKDCGPQVPGHQAPGHRAPGHRAPGHQAPGHQAPGHQALGQRALGQQAPRHQAPGQRASGHQAPGPRALGHQGSEFRAPVSLSAHSAREPIPAPISVSEEHKDTTSRTCIEIFTVTCGNTMGMLIKRKLERGARTKCIRGEDGHWFTPREFEVEGGREKSSNWRNSLHCGGKRLKKLMENKFLPDPPRIKGKKRKDNSNICKICRDGGMLYFCKTCRNFFHGDCHIPPVETNRVSWMCTFCIIQKSPRTQERHRESEVLARPMEPAEQLNCAFLLLKVYCHLEGEIYVKVPRENYIKMASNCLEKLRSLDKIKESLNGGKYPQVAAFVGAIAAILRNASTSQRYNSGQVEEEFKKSFREVFAVE